ncbi:MAG: GreA/GreB family elongation factor [Rhodospirillales bacterium]|nr:GreA/GreB family elongation factor [Rhodospirillales bacterium]
MDDDERPMLALGGKVYMTPEGHRRLRDEWHQLMKVERPRVVEIVSWAAGNGDRSENADYQYGKRRLREIDRRARYLTKRLEAAEVVDPARQAVRDRVFFGATVTYVDEADVERTITIVGADEADMAVVFEPFIAQGVKAGIWQEPFASMPKELGLFAWTTVNLPQSLIQSDPELAKAVVAATKKSLDLVFNNDAEMRAIAAEEFPTLPKDDLDAILTRARANDMWQQDGAMPEEAWDKTKSIITISGVLKEDVPYKDVFDPEFL